MLAKIAIAGATAAAIIGVGTAALATSGSSSTTGAGSSASSQHTKKADNKHDRGHRLRGVLRHTVHASVVTKGKNGFVTHTAVRGTVSSVSSTSLTVKAADGFSQTYTLAKTTHVRERGTDGKKGTKGTVADLKTGDKVAVVGTSPDKAGAVPTAQIVLDGLTK